MLGEAKTVLGMVLQLKVRKVREHRQLAGWPAALVFNSHLSLSLIGTSHSLWSYVGGIPCRSCRDAASFLGREAR